MHFISEMSATIRAKLCALHTKLINSTQSFELHRKWAPIFSICVTLKIRTFVCLRHRWGELKLIQNWCRVKVSGSRREFDGLVSTRAQALNESRALKPATSGMKQVVCYFLDIISPLNTCFKNKNRKLKTIENTYEDYVLL